MEFTPSLSAFQGVIISADSVHSFSKLTSRGGNEDKIQYVIESIRNFLQKEKYMIENKILEESVQIMRKFTFYVVINADLTILEEMVDLEGIDFVIWTIPTIPKCLLCEILWRLHMDTFIYEILVFSCPQLALEVADALIENFKYFNPTDCLHKLKLLTAASYRLLCRFVFFHLENDEMTHGQNNLQKCLNYFLDPPSKSKLDSLSKDEMYKFIGNRLYLMLRLLTDCFSNFVTVQKLKPSDFQQIYELTYKGGAIIENQTSIAISDCSNNSLLECINNSNILLLDVCKNLVMDVSVEIFCSWSEFEENGKSMQQTIGELCYKVHQTLCKIASISDHPIVAMLQQISCKPLDLIEVVKKTNTEDIVENINKRDNESAQWLKALLHIDNLVENKILMEQIAKHLEVFNEDECLKLFKILHSHLKANTDDIEYELLLAVRVFQRCSSSTKHEIVEEQFNNYLFNDNLQTPEFNNMMIVFFNKLIISPDMDASNVLSVFIQNPRKVYARIFNLASENIQQTHIMLKVMRSLEKFAKHYYNEETEPCIILVAKDIIANNLDTDEKQNNFIKFLSRIKTSKAIPGPKLFLLIIMPNLHSALLSKNFNSVYIHCKLLQEAYPLNELIEYRAPTLAMLAQVLDTVRWKIGTYLVLAPATLELVLNLQTSLLNTYEGLIPEKESKWLKSKLRNINPLNMYYFRRLWNPPGNTFVEVISGMHIHKDMDIEHLTVWLSQLINVCVTCVICIFALKSWQRSYDWQNEYQLYTHALNICPLNAKVHYNVAKVADAKYHGDWALAEYKEAIRLYPRYYQAMNNLANLLKSQKKYKEAEHYLRTSLHYKNDFPAAWMNLGIVLAHTGRYNDSHDAYKTALRYRNRYPDCFYNLGNLYLELNKTDDALENWFHAINLNPKHVSAWTNLLTLLDNSGQIEKALQIIPKALEELPETPLIHFAIANIYGKIDEYNKAEKYFIKAINLFQNRVQAIHYANLGVLYHRWKKYDLATQMYKKSLKIDSKFPSALKNLRNLERLKNKTN